MYGSLVRYCVVLCGAAVLACASPGRPRLSLRGGEPVVYRCASGCRILARYYTLSDNSLGFVKLTLPGGKEYTLPNVVSVSGARYTDDRELVWWVKGDSAFVQTRAANGEWEISIRDCGVARKQK